jgi:PIN domain nuclease of toxin-antitoxin system
LLDSNSRNQQEFHERLDELLQSPQTVQSCTSLSQGSLQVKENGVRLLPIEFRHVLALRAMPLPHKDPFDRILMAQSRADDLVIVTKDAVFAQYSFHKLW